MSSKATAYTCALSKDLQKKATKELNENPKCRTKDIQFLRERVIANRALTYPTDDYYLLTFLRAAKFDYDKAYERLLHYHTVRAKNCDVYMTMLPSYVKDKTLADGVITVLPSRDKQGRHILLARPAQWKYKSYSNIEIHKTQIMALEMMLEEEDATVNGFVYIVDFAGVSPGVVPYLERRQSKLTADVVQNGLPIRFKAAYCINAPAVFEIFYGLYKPLLKQKLKERVQFVKDLESLHKFIDKSALPEEYGGTLPKMDILAETCNKMLLSREDKFRKLMDHKLILDRKLGEHKEEDIVASVMGTFKKLDV